MYEHKRAKEIELQKFSVILKPQLLNHGTSQNLALHLRLGKARNTLFNLHLTHSFLDYASLKSYSSYVSLTNGKFSIQRVQKYTNKFQFQLTFIIRKAFINSHPWRSITHASDQEGGGLMSSFWIYGSELRLGLNRQITPPFITCIHLLRARPIFLKNLKTMRKF